MSTFVPVIYNMSTFVHVIYNMSMFVPVIYNMPTVSVIYEGLLQMLISLPKYPSKQ